MADANQETAQLAALLQQANKELAQFGQITQATQEKVTDAQMKAKLGVDNFSQSNKVAAQALGELAKGAVSTFKAMADGKKGAAAFNESIDHMTQAASLAAVALTLLIPGGPLIKGLVAGFTAVTVSVIQAKAEFQKMAATMSDKLYKSYSDLAKSGAAASTGMTGMLKLSKQMSLNMDEMSDFTSIVANNSQELALFGGTARQGVQRMGDMAEAMKGSRREFLAMGMSVTDVVEGQARYLREMSRTGRAQTMTSKELADSARNYILEQDRLSQITGMNAKQQQEVLDRAKSHEMFNSKIRQLELKGDAQSLAAANELKKGLQMAAAIGPQAEAGYKAMVTGNLRSADAQRLNFTTAGTAQREILAVASGQKKASAAFDNITKSVARHERTVGLAISGLSESSTVQLSSAEMERAAVQSTMSMEERERKAAEDQAKRGRQVQDKLLAGQVNVIDRQINANQEINDLVAQGIPMAQQGMIDVAEASVKAAKALAKLAGVYKEEKPTAPVANQMSSVGRDYKMSDKEAANAREALNDPGVSERDKAWLRQQLKNIEKRASGGPVDSSVPYLVGEEGPELFVPSTAGNIVPMNTAGNVSQQTADSSNKIKSAIDGILKEYQTQQESVKRQSLQQSEMVSINSRARQQTADSSNKIKSAFDGILKEYQTQQESVNSQTKHQTELGSITGETSGGIAQSTLGIKKSIDGILAQYQTKQEKVSNHVNKVQEFFETTGDINDINQTTQTVEKIKKSVDGIQRHYRTQQETVVNQTDKLKSFAEVEDKYFESMTEFMNSVMDQNNRMGGADSFVRQLRSNPATAGGNLRTGGAAQRQILAMAGGAAGGGSRSGGGGGGAGGGNGGSGVSVGQNPGIDQPTRNRGLESVKPLAGSHSDEGSSSAGQGIDPSKRSGLGLKDPLEQVNQAGLKVRPYGDVYQGGPMTDSALGAAKTIQDTVKNFGMFTGLNDKYHIEKHPRSAHAKGRGIDFTLKTMPTVEEAQEIKKQLQKISGVSLVMNEYFRPPQGDMNQYTTGPHFHVQTSAEKGGVFDGPNSGYPATLHGNEAVIPLQNNAGNFVKIFEEMASDNKNMLSLMQEMVKAQKDSVSVSNKMLRMQSWSR